MLMYKSNQYCKVYSLYKLNWNRYLYLFNIDIDLNLNK